MLIVISPAKKLNENTNIPREIKTNPPALLKEARTLVQHMKSYSPIQLEKLYKVSSKISQLNYERFQSFDLKNIKNTKSSIFLFNGDTYRGLNAEELKPAALKRANNQLRILSGLYGILSPLDSIQPYRLEMGTKLNIESFKNLYEFWGSKVTDQLNKSLKKEKILINLASQEYFKVIKKNEIQGEILDISFKEYKNDTYKTIGLFSKKARGMMANFILNHNIKKKENIKDFNIENYTFSTKLSSDDHFVFTRRS